MRVKKVKKGKRRLELVGYRAVIAFLFIMLVVGLGFWFIGYYSGLEYDRIYEGIRRYGQAIGVIKPEIEVIIQEFEYSDDLSLDVSSDYNYTWFMGNYGKLTSVRLDGTISKDGYAKVYLEHEDSRYLIFDSLRLKDSDIINYTSLEDKNEEDVNLIGEGEPIENKINENNSLDNNSIINKSLDKKIKIIITQSGERAAIDEVFSFNVGGEFNWDVDYDKLCTKWDVNGVNLCYGSSDCCAFLNIGSNGLWNDDFYLSYGRYGAKKENVVSVRVVYYDVNLSVPYVDIVYSDIEEMEAEFYEAAIEFSDICLETCLLYGFNDTEYRLLFIIEDANLTVSSIRYGVEREIIVRGRAPLLVREIKNFTVYGNFEIDLSKYFVDEDGDKLVYYFSEVEDVSIVIDGSTARIVPSYNFTGKRFLYFIASDGYYNVSSNVFEVEVVERPFSMGEVSVSEELIKPRVIINKPVRWVKKVNASYSVINLSVNISSDALSFIVRDVKEDRVIHEDRLKVNDEGIIKDASVYMAEKRIEEIEKLEDKLLEEKERVIEERPTATQEISAINEKLLELENERNRLTGYAVFGNKKGLLTRFFEWLFNIKISGRAFPSGVEDESKEIALIIEEIVKEVEIEYYTEAPIAEEENTLFGKRIVVSSDVHYENILAYTYLDDVARDVIKLYHVVDGKRELVENISYYDANNNGFIDKIEWVIPLLSSEVYEVTTVSEKEQRAILPKYAPGEIIIKFKEDPETKQNNLFSTAALGKPKIETKFSSVNKLNKKFDVKKSEKILEGREFKNIHKLKVKEEELEDAIEEYKQDPNVEYVEFNYLAYTFFVPSDALYNQQWAHQNTQAELGWDIERGNESVVIAIIDTGVDYNHEDLAINIWNNTDEIPSNSIDDDGNGYIDDILGMDFVGIDNSSYEAQDYTLIPDEDYNNNDTNPIDYHGHGTHCAGIAAAVSNNSMGVAGVCHKCKIMPVRAGFAINLGGTTYGFLEHDDIADAIYYAVDNGAKVISMSFGGPASNLTRDAINYAYSKNVTLIAAAGNDNSDYEQYPAAYDNVIAIAASDSSDNRASFSNYGYWTDVAAPGVSILSTALISGPISDPSGYESASGTSMATPYVAGLAGLILSKNGSWSPDEVRRILKQAVDLPNENKKYMGTGRVNVNKAVQIDSLSSAVANLTYPSNGDIVTSSINITGTAIGDSYNVYYGNGIYPSLMECTPKSGHIDNE